MGYLTGFGSDRNQDAIAIRLHDADYVELTECDILERKEMDAVNAYKGNANGVNRQKMNDARRANNEKCE
ncbi:MAG: hypothetical protein OXI44_01385 [Bacteroidota bacterium]|nr:hypothetical protein [Bacteroidota bacterium]